LRLTPKPVVFQALPQPQSCPEKHYPQIGRRDRQNLTRLLTLEAVELAQAESLRLRSRQRRDAVGKDLPELLLFQRGIGVVPGRGLDAPMVAVGAVEELLEQAFALVVGGSGVRGTRFAGRSAPMVGELVLEDADEPGPFRRAAGKTLAPAPGGEQRFLDQIFRGAAIAH